MILKILIILTILSIIGEYKGTKGANDISEYMEKFDMDAFNELNLVCYTSMYGLLKGTLNYLNNNQDEIPNYIISLSKDIDIMYDELLQVNGWFKYLLNQPLTIIHQNYSNIKNWIQNLNESDLIQNALNSTIDGMKFIPYEIANLKTPKAKKFFEIFYSHAVEEYAQMINRTFLLCKNTLNTLSKQTKDYDRLLIKKFLDYAKKSEIPLTSSYGCLVLLMTADDFNHFNTLSNDIQILYLVRVIDDVVRDIFIGIKHILNGIDISNIRLTDLKKTGTRHTEVDLLKMIIPALQRVFKLSILLNLMMNLKDVFENIPATGYSRNVPFIISDEYSIVTNDIKNTFATKFQQIENFEPKQTIKLVLKNQEKVTKSEGSSGSGSSLLPNGRLIRDERVFPSIIGYYAVFNESWENELEINYHNNTDNRIVFLMELYAWSKVFEVKSRELLDLQKDIGVRLLRFKTPSFTTDNKFISRFKHFFI